MNSPEVWLVLVVEKKKKTENMMFPITLRELSCSCRCPSISWTNTYPWAHVPARPRARQSIWFNSFMANGPSLETEEVWKELNLEWLWCSSCSGCLLYDTRIDEPRGGRRSWSGTGQRLPQQVCHRGLWHRGYESTPQAPVRKFTDRRGHLQSWKYNQVGLIPQTRYAAAHGMTDLCLFQDAENFPAKRLRFLKPSPNSFKPKYTHDELVPLWCSR